MTKFAKSKSVFTPRTKDLANDYAKSTFETVTQSYEASNDIKEYQQTGNFETAIDATVSGASAVISVIEHATPTDLNGASKFVTGIDIAHHGTNAYNNFSSGNLPYYDLIKMTATTLGESKNFVGVALGYVVDKVAETIPEEYRNGIPLEDLNIETANAVLKEIGKDLGIIENINPNEIVVTPYDNQNYTSISYKEVYGDNNDTFDLNDLSYKVNNGLYWNNENSESFQAIIQRDQEAAKQLQENEKLNQQWIAEQQSKEYFEWIPTEEVIIETPPVGADYQPQSSDDYLPDLNATSDSGNIFTEINQDNGSYSFLPNDNWAGLGYASSDKSAYSLDNFQSLIDGIHSPPSPLHHAWGDYSHLGEPYLGETLIEKPDLSISVDNFFTPDEIDAFTGVGVEIGDAFGVSLSGSLNDFADIDDGDFMTADSIDHWLDTFDDIPDTVVANTDDFGNIIGLVSVDFDEPTSFNIYDDLADLTDNWDSGVDSSISAVETSILDTSDWNTSGWINDFADSSLDSTSLLDSFHTDFGTAYWDNSFSNFDDGFDYGLTDYGYSLDSFDNFDYSFDSFDYGMDSFDSFSTVDSFSYEPSIDFSPSFDFDFGGGSFW